MTIVNYLVEAIKADPLRPARIEPGPEYFRRFQMAHRAALAEVLPDAGNVYPGSLVGVPVIEAQDPCAVPVRADGTRVALEPLQREACAALPRHVSGHRATLPRRRTGEMLLADIDKMPTA